MNKVIQVDSRKSNLEKLEEELVKEGSDGQWTVLEDIDTEALKKTVGMTKDEIYQDDEDEFEYDNISKSDQLYFKSARNRLKNMRIERRSPKGLKKECREFLWEEQSDER